MTERQKQLVTEYGPMFIARARIIQTEMLKLAPDALSIFMDEEWKDCAEAMTKFSNELAKLHDIAITRTNEALKEGEDFIDLYGTARQLVKYGI